MNKELFHQTYSQIRASDPLKKEVLNLKQRKHSRKGLRTALIAAALVMLFTTTALAAAHLGRSQVETDDYLSYTPTDANGDSFAVQTHRVSVDLQPDPNAPTSITAFYLPELPEGYTQYHGFLYKDNVVVQYRWKEADGFSRDISLTQWAGGLDEESVTHYTIYTAPDAPTPILREVTWGGLTGLTVDSQNVAGLRGERIFFWTDGSYVFHLTAPVDFSDEQMDHLLSSIREVENIRPWLIGMSEAQITSVLGN